MTSKYGFEDEEDKQKCRKLAYEQAEKRVEEIYPRIKEKIFDILNDYVRANNLEAVVRSSFAYWSIEKEHKEDGFDSVFYNKFVDVTLKSRQYDEEAPFFTSGTYLWISGLYQMWIHDTDGILKIRIPEEDVLQLREVLEQQTGFPTYINDIGKRLDGKYKVKGI